MEYPLGGVHWSRAEGDRWVAFLRYLGPMVDVESDFAQCGIGNLEDWSIRRTNSLYSGEEQKHQIAGSSTGFSAGIADTLLSKVFPKKRATGTLPIWLTATPERRHAPTPWRRAMSTPLLAQSKTDSMPHT